MTSVHATTASPRTARRTLAGAIKIDSQRGASRTVNTVATVTFSNTTTATQPYQQQIDDINAQLPVKDVEVIGTTNLLANYLLNRGTL